MCLTTYLMSPLKAEEDRKVYKVLYRNHDGLYYAPVVRDTEHVSYVYTKGENMPYPSSDDEPTNIFAGERNISSGWLHSYRVLREAVHMMEQFNCEAKVIYGCGEYVIVEMTIPKDCEYYVSKDMFECCSKVLEWDGNIFMEDKGIKRIIDE